MTLTDEQRARILATARALTPDALICAGALAFAHGVDLIYRPAAWLTIGAAMIVVAVLLARKGKT